MGIILQVISMLSGYALVGYTLYVTGASNSNNFEVLFNIYHKDSLFFVTALLVGVVLIAFNIEGFFSLIKYTFILLFSNLKKRNKDFENLSRPMADAYYKSDLAFGRSKVSKLPKVWKKIYDGLEKKINPRDIMEIVKYDGRHEVEKIDNVIRIFKNLAAVSASVGVLGTIIGLIKLFKNMSDFSTIGDNMALAFLTTLYGVLYGSIVFGPLGTKLQKYKDDVIKSYMDSYYWLEVVADRKPPSYLDNKKV